MSKQPTKAEREQGLQASGAGQACACLGCVKHIVAELGADLCQLLLNGIVALPCGALQRDAAQHKVAQLNLNNATLRFRQLVPGRAGPDAGTDAGAAEHMGRACDVAVKNHMLWGAEPGAEAERQRDVVCDAVVGWGGSPLCQHSLPSPSPCSSSSTTTSNSQSIRCCSLECLERLVQRAALAQTQAESHIVGLHLLHRGTQGITVLHTLYRRRRHRHRQQDGTGWYRAVQGSTAVRSRSVGGPGEAVRREACDCACAATLCAFQHALAARALLLACISACTFVINACACYGVSP